MAKQNSRIKRMMERHAKLLEAQRQKAPALTFPEMMEILGIASSSAVKYILDSMIEAGLIEKRRIGNSKKHTYFFLEPK